MSEPLLVRRADLVGMLGTGGTGSLGISGARLVLPGDGDRKLRSAIELELPRRCRPLLNGWRWEPPPALIKDELESRRTMRFVRMSPTGTGEVVAERRAAAAAAEDKLLLRLGWDPRKAAVAATEAAVETFGGGCCW